VKLTNRQIFLFWAPLAATWLMMAFEGPFLAAVIARLADPTFNLAAHGVAFAFAILIEAPVIMLMSAATALVEDATSYRKLRNFANALNGGATLALLVLLLPPVFDVVAETLLGLPPAIADKSYHALWFYLPWPASIGIRRFLQGVLIRSGRTRLVAIGTVIRLFSMVTAALALAGLTDLPGAAVGGGALSTGVLVEAAVARWMARDSIRALLAVEASPESPGLSYADITGFYIPLALTSLIGLAVQPMLTFFMGRSVSPVESLAVFPVVNSLSFIFRSLGLAFQDAAIALIGRDGEHREELGRFALWLGGGATAVLAAIAFTPLAVVWFETVSGLEPALARFAYAPTRLAVPMASLSVLLSLQRAVLIKTRRTRPITVATFVEAVLIAGTFAVGGWGLGWVGVTAAFAGFAVGRAGATAYLAVPLRRSLRAWKDG
jgi:Na+-driven multidrug efflux pump